MSYNIDQIKIILDTNIPGKTRVPLTSSLLYNPKLEGTVLEEWPYITFDDYYPSMVLSRMSYADKVAFFFNKDRFVDIMRRHTNFGKATSAEIERPVVAKTGDQVAKERKAIERIMEETEQRVAEIQVSLQNRIQEAASSVQNTAEYKTWLKTYEAFETRIRDELEQTPYTGGLGTEKLEQVITKLKEFFKENRNAGLAAGFDVDAFPYDNIQNVGRRKSYASHIGANRQVNDGTKSILDQMRDKAISSKIKNMTDAATDRIKTELNDQISAVRKESQTKIDKLRTSVVGGASVVGEAQSLIINNNVMMMLEILFPTSYPVPHNISTSYDMIVLKDSGFKFTLDDLVPGFAKKYVNPSQSVYSYLKLDGKTYTITQVIWLNDIYNHPDYSDLVLKYTKLGVWKAKERERLLVDIQKRQTRFKQDFSKGGQYEITDEDIERLNTSKAKLPADTIGSSRYAEIGRNIDELVLNIGRLNLSTGLENPDYTIVSDMAINIEKLYQKIKGEIQIPQKLAKGFADLMRQTEGIRVAEIILTKYINNPDLIVNFENEDQKVRDELNSKYKEYTGFGTFIKDFVRPKKESTNKVLQEEFESFLENTSTFFVDMMQPSNLVKGAKFSSARAKQSLHTGITVVGEGTPKYEINVRVDVIGGEINDETRSKVNCVYQGESLGVSLDSLMGFAPNPWELDKKTRFFFDISSPEVQNALSKASPKPELGNKPEPEPAKIMGGMGGMGGGATVPRKYRHTTRELRLLSIRAKTRKNHV